MIDVLELQQYVNVWDGKEFKVDNLTGNRADLIQDTLKYPGEMNLCESIFSAKSAAKYYDKNSLYTNLVPRSRDWVSFWEKQKELSYTGLLIDDIYISGDTYWYWNFIRIPNKVARKETFPNILDSDIWFMNLLELAPLLNKFTATVKKRQWGFSLKMIAKQLKRFMFEETFTGKISAWEEKYVKENWKLLDIYRDHLQSNTAWKRPLDPHKTLDWMQKVRMSNGASKGLKSSLKGITTKSNPAAVVSGKTDEIFMDESGINPTLDETIEFVTPALSYNDLITGELHIGGAVGQLKDCRPLREIFFNPDKHNFLALPNIWSNRPSEKVGIFVPEYYNYYTDEFGNSDVEKAKEDIILRAEKEKDKSYKSYMMYMSQRPMTPEDAFAEREENIFPIHIIKPHYEKLEREYKPLKIELHEQNGVLKHSLGSKYDVVEDFPVKKNTLKHGVVVIDEMPYPNAPFGLYYAGVDTITPIPSTSSVSLQSIYIYKAAHEVAGEFSADKVVAWYCGRPDSNYGAFEITKKLIKFYNARAGIENDNRNFIEWMIKERQQKHIMRRNEFPLTKDTLATSSISNVEYGIRTGNKAMKEYLITLAIEYITEVVGNRFNDKTGEAIPIYGVERVKDKMLLREMMEYIPKKNVDRIMAFAIALFAARSNTNRGLKVVKKEQTYNKIKTKKPSVFAARYGKSVFKR